MNGHVASAFLSFMVTVVGSVASTDFSDPNSVYGPVGSAILTMRSSENLTSSDVSGSPLENFRSGLSLQTYVFGSENSQLSAASGSGLLPPAGTDSRFWYMLPISCWEPRSYAPTGSSATTLSVVPRMTVSALPFGACAVEPPLLSPPLS